MKQSVAIEDEMIFEAPLVEEIAWLWYEESSSGVVKKVTSENLL